MAEIEFNCPACGQVLEAPEEMAGESLACPSCEAPITIPAPAPDTPDDSVAASLFSTPPDAALDEPYTESAAHVCPECGGALAEGAVLCVQCGFHLKLGRKIATEFD